MGRLSALGLAVFALLLWLAMFAGDRRERKRASPDPSAEGKPSAGKDADGATSAAPPDTKAAQPDPRGLHELALEIAAAQRGSDPETLDERLGAIHKSWQGRRYRWEVGHVAALCASAARCAVLPFDQKRFERPVVQGWLPTLELTPEALARIGTPCPRRAFRCEQEPRA